MTDFSSNIVFVNALIDMYAEYGITHRALKLFEFDKCMMHSFIDSNGRRYAQVDTLRGNWNYLIKCLIEMHSNGLQ